MQSGRTLVIILQANKFFYERGGSERYFFALSTALAGRGHEVVHFSMQHPRNLPSPYSGYFVAPRDYVSPRPAAGSWRALREFVRSPEAARRLAGLLDEATPDVAHLHNIYHQLTPSIIDVLWRRGVPMVMTLHDYKLVCPSYGMFAHGACCYRCRGGRFRQAIAVACAGSRTRSAMLAFESYWQRWTRVYDRVDRFVAPSEYLRGVMVEAGMAPERIVYVAPLNPSAASPAAGPGEDAPAASFPARFVAYVGRLSPEKGIRVLLAAARELPEVSFVLFGEGPDGAALRAIAAADRLENVTFAGYAERAVIDAALRRAAAVVLPTLSPENAPMAVLEAAEAGAPVIVSDRGGLPELARHAGGDVVPAGDPSALARAIRDAWEDGDGARARARQAWRDAQAMFAPDAHLDAIEAIYRRVISARRVAA